jgi:hypothetical protein
MATRPGLGRVAAAGSIGTALTGVDLSARLGPGRYHNGLWRPDMPFHGAFGVRIVMRHEPGVTKGDILRVPFRFQTPSLNSLDRPYQYTWATYDTIRVGQKARPFGRQLLTVQVNTMFMDGPSADASQGVVIWPHRAEPQRMLEELRWIMGYEDKSEADVFRLVLSQPAVWGSQPLVNMLATLITVEPVQQQDEIGTEYVGVTFQEFPVDEEIARKQRPQAYGATRWTLRAGDTLYEIAKKSHWHQPSAWKTIAKANGIIGVSPSSAGELEAWAKKHHKTQLSIPPKGRS